MKYVFVSDRSRFVIALQEYKAPGEGTSFLSFLKGDLILLEEDSTGETVLNNGWCIGESQLSANLNKNDCELFFSEIQRSM